MSSYDAIVHELPLMEGPIQHFITTWVEICWTTKTKGRKPKTTPTPAKMRALMSSRPDKFEYDRTKKTWKKFA